MTRLKRPNHPFCHLLFVTIGLVAVTGSYQAPKKAGNHIVAWSGDLKQNIEHTEDIILTETHTREHLRNISGIFSLPNDHGEKIRTFFDYKTHFAAYKDLIESRCYLERIRNTTNTRLSQNMTAETRSLYISDIPLTKIQIWRLAGSRISEFCRGFPTLLLQETKPINIAYQDDENELLDERSDESKTRRRRQTTRFFSGRRYKGQTQSQYLNFGNAQQPGKAEAESSPQGSRAVVSGNSGMGQAQSQSGTSGSCEDCYGVRGGFDSQSQALGYRPGGYGRPGEATNGRYPGRTPPEGPDGTLAPVRPGELGLRPSQHIPGTFQPGQVTGGTGQIPPGYRPGYRPTDTTTGLRPGETGVGLQPGLIHTGFRPSDTVAGQRPGENGLRPGAIPPGYRPDQTISGVQPGVGMQPGAIHIGMRPGDTVSGLPPGLSVGVGFRPGETVTGLRPGETVTGLRPGETVTGLRPGETVTGLRPGETVTGLRPGETVTGLRPGETVTGLRPGETVTGLRPGETVTGLRPGETAIGLRPSETVSGMQPGQIHTGFRPGDSISGMRPGEIGTGIPPGQIHSGGQRIPGTVSRPEGPFAGQMPSGVRPGDTVPGQVDTSRPIFGPSDRLPDITAPVKPPASIHPSQITHPGAGTTDFGRAPAGPLGEIYRPGVHLSGRPSLDVYSRPTGEFVYHPGVYPGRPGSITGRIATETEIHVHGGHPYVGSYPGHTYPDSQYPTSHVTGQYPPSPAGDYTITGQYPTAGGTGAYPGIRHPSTHISGRIPARPDGQYPTTGQYPNGQGVQTTGAGPRGPDQTGHYPGVQIPEQPPGAIGQYPGPQTIIQYPAQTTGQFPGQQTTGHFPSTQTGQFPGTQTTGQASGTQTTGQFPGTETGQFIGTQTGQFPGVQPTGQFPGVQPTGQYPAVQTTGQFPGVQTTGQYPGVQRPSQYPGAHIPEEFPSQPTTGQFPGQQTTGQFPGSQTMGQYPGTPTTGQFPGVQTTGQFPDQQTTGAFPGQQTGRFPGQQTVGQLPGQPTTGQLPGQQTTAQLPGQQTGQLSGQPTNGQYPGTQVNGGQTTGGYPGQRPGVDQNGGAPYPIVDPSCTSDYGCEYPPGAEDADSQAQSSVQQVDKEIQASASAQGRYMGGTAQSQVSGTYSGTGSFSAQAGTIDGKRGAQTQVSGGKEGATSSAQGNGGYGQSQSQVQLAAETGAATSSSQTSGWNHGTNSQVQADEKGGMADAQANGPGSTSSQAQIGFSPPDNKDDNDQNTPFRGGGTANAQSGTFSGQSQSQIQGKFKYGIRYTGAAQAQSGTKESLDKTQNQTISAGPIRPIEPLRITELKKPNIPTQTTSENHKVSKNNPQHQTQHTSSSHNEESRTGVRMEPIPTQTTVHKVPSNPQSQPSNPGGTDKHDDMDYEYEDDYDATEEPDTDASPSDGQRSISQNTKSQTQHILLGPLEDLDAHVIQATGEPELKEGMLLQPGQAIPGMPGYQIPPGYRGRVTSVAYGDKTMAIGRDSQAQSVTITPGTGRINYITPKSGFTQSRNGSYIPYTYYKSSQPPTTNTYTYPKFMTVTKSESGSKNLLTGKKSPQVYYTQSSTCGFFTNTCVFSGAKKICIPKAKSNPDGTPMVC